MATALEQAGPVLVESSPIRQGMNGSTLRYLHADTPSRPATVEEVMDFLHGNVIESAQEGCVDEELIRSQAGVLHGWIAAGQLPLSARTQRNVL